MHTNLNSLLMRSLQLEKLLFKLLDLGTETLPDRTASSRIMCGVAFEHAESLKMLIARGNFTSATGLLRLQYEALVRATWLQYAAPDKTTARLMGEFNQENAKKADRLPMMTEMLNELEGKAPADAMALLLQFKEYSWKPLSSYVHGGIHVLHRHGKGYPPFLIHQAVKASNTVSIMIVILLARLANDKKREAMIPVIQLQFADCLLEPRSKTSHKHKNSGSTAPAT